MRNARLDRASFVLALSGCMIAGAAPAGERASRDAMPPLERGEIVIRKTGRTRVTRTVVRPTTATVEPVKELPYGGAGPRSVTIGYFVRDPIETGWGPQVHGYGYSPCPSYGDSYGYGGYSYPIYSYGGHGYGGSFFGSSYCGSSSFFGGSSSYCGPSSSVSFGRIGR
jgi:hypothetical protein